MEAKEKIEQEKNVRCQLGWGDQQERRIIVEGKRAASKAKGLVRRDPTCSIQEEWKNGAMQRYRIEKGYKKDKHGNEARKKINECESREGSDTVQGNIFHEEEGMHG